MAEFVIANLISNPNYAKLFDFGKYPGVYDVNAFNNDYLVGEKLISCLLYTSDAADD